MSKTGLLLMDLQNAIFDYVNVEPGYVARIQQVAAAARKAGMPVIYVVVRFRPQHPEISAGNKAFSTFISRGMSLQEGELAAEVHSSVAPQAGDIVVTKRRVSAFSGSDLEVVLRSLDIEHIVLMGIATSGVVLSTLREAADMDYKITILSDCCFDRDEEVHRVLTDKVFPTQADVLRAEEWLKQLVVAV